MFQGRTLHSDTGYPAVEECTFRLQYFSFDKSIFSVKISLLKNFQSVPVGMCLQLEWVSHIHCPLAHIAVIQTDIMIRWVFGRLVLVQWQRDASVISCSFNPHGGPVEVTSSLHIAATVWMQMIAGRTWKKMGFWFRFYLTGEIEQWWPPS